MPGTHVIKAVMNIFVAEEKVTDNTLIGGTVIIRLLGDLNGDNKADIEDIAFAPLAFGSYNYPVSSPVFYESREEF